MRSTFAALRHRNYRIFAGAGFVSIIGTWMQVLGVNWYVLQQTGSATKMGFAVLLQALPTLVLSTWGGALADRLPARPLLVGTQIAHATLAALLAAVAWSHFGGLTVVYAVSLVGGAVAAIEGPVMGRWGSTLVDRATLGNALALGSLSNSAGRILGMSVGAIVVAAAGPAPLFALNAVSFGAVMVGLLAVRQRELHTHDLAPAAAADTGGIRAGLAYLRGQPVVLTTLLLAFVLGSLGRNYQVTMAAMSDGPLHAGASGYGSFSTIFAVGTVLGALAAARRGELTYRLLVGVGLLGSVLQIFAGLAPGPWSFAAFILPIAATAVLIDTTVGTRAQLDTAGVMRGRVLAAVAVAGSVSAAVGAPLLGWLSEHAGPRQTLVLAGTTTAIACLLAGVALARQDRMVLRIGLPAAVAVPVTRTAARLRPRSVMIGATRLARRDPAPAVHAAATAAISHTCRADHDPAPAGALGTTTAPPARVCAACAPRYGRPRRRSAEAATSPTVEAASPTR